MNENATIPVLRKAERIDFAQVYALLCELENEHLPEDPFKANFLENLESNDWLMYIVQWADQSVGFCSLHFKRSLHHAAEIAELEELIINSNQRSLGIGKKVIDELIEICKQRNVHQLELSTNKTRERAKQFYLLNGFAESHFKMVQSF
ncbi:GNAT family N-acetyltransferase [Marinilongibacter aquaticus]|uniref:GNAT family N-acetyltransferase n=1 Tax=Marinilongibacter aquaticus TaxID=2975157 RepID=UPI0021BDA1FB|nr:GNAT family N-acetyltransferase [Marinilongibacter aquaticus]UBM58324.1 GNAT family N-acetyltransferase [Marinilongibacter aquaticus]